MKRPMVSMVMALLLAMSGGLIADRPAQALGRDDEEATLSPTPSASSPILEALAFAGLAAAGVFSPAGSLAEARMEHTATLLAAGATRTTEPSGPCPAAPT